MKNGSIQHRATSARWILRNDMLGKWPESQSVVVLLVGVTPACKTKPRSRKNRSRLMLACDPGATLPSGNANLESGVSA